MVAYETIHFHLCGGGGECLLLAGQRPMQSNGPAAQFSWKLTQQLLQNTLDAPVVVPVARVANRCRRNFQGIKDCNNWWSTASIDMFLGAPFRLNEFMTKRCFLEITAAIVFTDVPPPTAAESGFVDRFQNWSPGIWRLIPCLLCCVNGQGEGGQCRG